MAGIMDIPMHRHAGGAGMKMMHKRIAIKRQGPGGGLQDGTGDDDDDGNPTTGGSGGSLSLTRGPGGGNGGASSTGFNTGGDDDDDTSSSTEAPTRSRTRTTVSSNSTPSDTTPTTSAPTTADTSITTVPDTSSVPVVTTTVQTTSTSTSFSEPETTRTTLEEETTTSEEPTTTPTTSASRSLVTSFVTASGALTSLASSATNSLASSNNNNNGSSGPSAGTVVGIVAGALVGVVVLSGIVGYVFRTKCTSKNDEDDFDGENPFGHIDDHNNNGGGFGSGQSRAEMRRDSQLLADDGDSIHQMSELGHGGAAYNNNAAPIGMGMGMAAAGAGAGAYALNRGNSTNNGAPLPGLQRQDTMNPRPPTMIQRHYANQQQMQQNMPSFQPGQIVYPTGNGGQPQQQMMNQSSPYPTFPHNAAGGGVPVGGVFPSSSSPSNNNDLSRNQSYRAIPEQYNNNGGYDYHQQQQQQQEQEEMPARSGTPEYANPQQYFHQATESFGSGIGPSPFGDHNASPAHGGNAYTSYDNNDSHLINGDGGMGYGGGHTNDGGAVGTGQQGYASFTPRDNVMKGSDRAKRTLSVRNGALDDDGILRESVYGGM